MQGNSREEIEIDVIEIIGVLLRKLWLIIFFGIIFAVGAGLFSELVMEPVYTSITQVYIIHRQNKETTTYSDLQTGTQLAIDYKILVLSRPVTEEVIRTLKLDITHEDLISGIRVEIPSDSRILVIKVENRDPVLAKQIADSMASVSSRQMVTVMGLEEVNVVEPGNIPTKPSKPKVKLNTAIGGIMGCLLSAVFIIIQYIMDDSIKNSEDIEKHLAITTLGTIPRELAKKNSKTNKKKTQKKKYRRRKDREDNSYSLDKEQLDTTSNESYKSLRTNLQFCGKDVKTICITSCLPNEGKTVVSLRLASTIAEAGKKVLFIDADLRKSVILGKLRIENELYGLSQYLSGMNELKEVINKTSVVNVDMIFTGPLPPNPSEMLAGDMFKTLIMTQRGVYDYILVDTPPLGVVIDSANVAQVCDGTIIVIEADHISYKFAQRVVKQLIQGKCRVLGAVLNKVNMKRKDYYGKNYGKYYGKYYTSNKR